jgi:serine/threonine protein phosphatase PrpC
LVAEIDYQINTDAIFLKGTDHLVCQDYATNFGSNKENNHIIVCDGCSSSPMSDVGARILALKTAELTNKDYIKNNEDLISCLIDSLKYNSELLKINPQMLDTTLLTAYIKDDKSYILNYGDGVSITKFKNGNIKISNICFEQGYPNYLSYRLDKARYENYKSINQIQKHEGYFNFESTDNYEFIIDYLGGHYNLNLIEWIILTSDGIHSFYKKDENGKRTSIDFLEIAKQLVDFKNFHGVFVERHVRSLIKRLEKQNIFHYDDFSVAGLYVKN